MACNLLLSSCCELERRRIPPTTGKARGQEGEEGQERPVKPHASSKQGRVVLGRDLIKVMLPSKILSTNAFLCTTAARYCAAKQDVGLLEVGILRR